MAGIAQVAMCTTDMARTIRTFVEVLGFGNGGGRPRWGLQASLIQGLSTGDDTYLMMWWLVGRQDFFQLEFFQHANPPVRPRRMDWSPADVGWTRFGVVVPDFDLTLHRLQRAGHDTLTKPAMVGGARRVCFREPGADIIVEILEAPPSHPDSGLSSDAGPAVAYVAASVRDLDSARRYFTEAFGFAEVDGDALHLPENEALWGLDGASRKCAVLSAGDILLELVEYSHPTPKPPSADAMLSDQGMMNIAIGYRDREDLVRDLDTALERGTSATTEAPLSSGSVYLRSDDQLSLEMLLVPPGHDASFGFVHHELSSETPYALVRTTAYDR